MAIGGAAAASAILGAAAGGGGGGLLGASQRGGASTIPALAVFKSYAEDQVGARRNFAERADVVDEIAYFKKSVEKFDDVDELLEDQRSLGFLLVSFGLQNEINNPGKLRAILESDPNDINSFANRLADTRFAELAKFVDYPNTGFVNLNSPSKQSELTDKYLTNQFERELGFQNPAVRDALFFLRRIGTVQNTFEILGNGPLRAIVTDALNLPPEIARQSVNKQASLIDAKLNLENFQLNSLTSGSKSRLEYLNDDKEALTLAQSRIDAGSTALTGIVDALEDIRTGYEDLASLTDASGVLQDEITIQEAALDDLLQQRGLVAAAELGVTNTRTALDELETIFNNAYNAEDADDLAGYQADFTAIIDEILGDDGYINGASFYNPATGETNNILRNGTGSGSLPTGIDAVASQISTDVHSDGTKVITNSSDLDTFLDDLTTFRTNFLAADFATLESDLDTAEAEFTSAISTFEPVENQTAINVASVNNGLNSVTFGVTLESDNLALAQASARDAQTRLTRAQELIADIRAQAELAQDASADFVAIDAEYQNLLSDLNDVLTTPGDVTDGTSTTTLDNLLTSGNATYTAYTGTPNIDIRIEGGDLVNDLYNLLPANLSDAATGATLQTAIDDTYDPLLEDTAFDLARDGSVAAFASQTLDPAGALDEQARRVAAQIDELLGKATVEGKNLVQDGALDLRVPLGSTGSVLTIEGQSDFRENFVDAIEALEYVILNGGTDSERVEALNNALFYAQGAQTSLQAESYALNIQTEIIDTEITAIQGTGTGANDFLKPLEFTDEALEFIERYLVQKDLEAQGLAVNGPGAFNPDAALIGTIKPILPPIGASLNLLL